MRFVMGLGWGMVVELALGFVLCCAVVQRFAVAQPVAWRSAVAKISPNAQPVQTLAKA